MWLPHTTVAAIVEKDEKFLMVHELSDGKEVFNQPAGHLEADESLIEACIRETLEETQWIVEPTSFLGISQYLAPNGETYIRHSFIAKAIELNENSPLDKDILKACWLSYEDILDLGEKLRSPVVREDLIRYRQGFRIDLSAVRFY